MNLMITYKDTTYNDMAAMNTYESYEQYPMFSPRQKCVTTVHDNTGRTTSNYLFNTKGGFFERKRNNCADLVHVLYTLWSLSEH
jgi:hypothetical protein